MSRDQNKRFHTALLENRSSVVNVLLIMVDIITVSSAVMLSAVIRYLLVPLMGGVVNWPLIINSLVFFVIFTVILAWLNGLYPGFGLAAVQEMQKVLYVVGLAAVFLGVILFLQQLGMAFSRMIFVLTWFLSALFMMLGRFAIRNRFSRFPWWGIPMIVIGSQDRIAPVIEKLLQTRRLGFRPVYYFDPGVMADQPISGVLPLNNQQALKDLVIQSKIQHVVLTDPVADFDLVEFEWMRDVFPNILFILDSAPFGSLWVRTIDVHGTLAIETSYHLLNKQETIIKRVLDMILTLMLLLVSWPIFILLAALVRLDSKGPVLYTQKRLGQDGEAFDSYKFRTMYEDADEKLHELLASDAEADREYQEYHKLTNDPRVTRVGRVLRRYSLDEMPQFINVLKGDMNLIGPRSYLPRELPDMGTYAKIILKVKPGITGWWQVMGRNETSFKERLQLDEYYISNWSIWLDLYVIIKTAWVLIRGEGL
ncbi:MAG: undecaprenyl-phosphate galactose phosphotransferase WbaP [Brevefilum sp.]|nr:undecaprenyl-phosphate galactose phosphotransferase WbaP [Brevefilum sp.]